MPQPGFITRPMSICLDLIRAAAALAVLIGHAAQLDLYTGPYPFTIALQQNAVIVFFVLSGLVIAASTDPDRQTLKDFAIARAARILPVAWPALVLALVLMLVTSEKLIDGPQWLRAALFLTESWRTAFDPNPPYWSLCYEVWFYALFAAASFLTGWKRLFWLVVFALIASPNVLLLLPAWLFGAVAARSPRLWRMPFWLAALLVALAIAMLFIAPKLAVPGFIWLRTVATWPLGHSHYALSYNLLALALAFGFIGLRRLLGECQPWLERLAKPARAAADMSFSLYLIHWQLLGLLLVNNINAGDSVAKFALLILLIAAAAAVFAQFTEHRRHAVRRWLRSLTA